MQNSIDGASQETNPSRSTVPHHGIDGNNLSHNFPLLHDNFLMNDQVFGSMTIVL